jgi:hypothetical protein
VLLAAGGIFLLSSCDRIVMSGGRKSPSGRYTTWVWAYGAYGKSFTNITAKTIEIYVSGVLHTSDTNGPMDTVNLYQSKFTVTGGHLWWDCIWFGDTNVVVDLLDYGEIDGDEAREKGLKPRWERNINLCLDESKGTFVKCR